MGARIVGKRKHRADGLKDTRTIALIIAAVVSPCLLAYLLIAADMRIDLSELKARHATWNDGATLVSWAKLALNVRSDISKRAQELPLGRARMLGYMMDGYQPVPNGTPVKMFMLMPEAGQLLHPAHRIPDEMVEVWPADGKSILYNDRRMVWVEGILREAHGMGAEQPAAYAITQASVTPADDREIAKWFLP